MNVKILSIYLLLLFSVFVIDRSMAQPVSAIGTVTNVHCHGDSTGSISYHIYGGPAPVHYVWNTGDSGISVGGCTYAVHITNPGAALTNFQIQVNLAYASGMTANFSNVVFTDSLGNAIPFWLQDFPTATNATFWVRVPAIPAGNSTIYLSFCGSSATSAGNPNTTFEFFDNFDSGTFGTWTQACLTPMAGSTCAASASNTVSFSPGYSAYLSAHSTCFTSPYSGAGSTISHTVNPMVNDSLVIDYNDKVATTLYGFCSGGTGSTNSVLADNVGLGNGRSNGQGGSCATNTGAWANETSLPFAVSIGQTTITLKTYGGDCDNSQGWFDNVRIRKYRAHPPTVVLDTTPQLFLNHLAAGTYTITMTAANGTVTTSNFVVTQPTAIAPQLDSTDVTCFGFNNGSAWVASEGGTAPYTFLWSNAQTTDTIKNLIAGPYHVVVTDSFGCLDSALINVLQPATSVSALADSINVSCKGQATGKAWVTASGGTPGYTFSWGTQTTDTISNLSPGYYTVIVTDTLGCTATASVNITEPAAALSVSIDSTNVLCKGDATGKAWSTAAGGTPGYAYLWNNTLAGDTINGMTAGLNTVVATDTLGCTATASVNITEPANPLSAVLDSNNISCKGYTDGKAWVIASGGTAGYTYLWSNTQTGDTIRNLGAGVYMVQVTDAHSCTVNGSVNILPSTDSVVIDTAVIEATCGLANGSITITPSGGSVPYQYVWSTGPTTQTLSGINGGSYIVTVSDNAGCFSSKSITVIQYPALAYTVITQNDTCGMSLGSASVSITTGTQPYTYLWSGGEATPAITAVKGGAYNVTVSDSTGCNVAGAYTVTNIEILPEPTFGATDTPICGSGSFIKLSPGTFSSYLWQDNSTSPTYTALHTGTYSVIVTNIYGCKNNATIIVTNNCNSAVMFPTAFSPNGDGVNDLFHPIYTPDLIRFHMTIYDRWGEKVFESSDFTDGWDGTYKNVAQPIGTYIWFADYTFDGKGSKTQTGNITLLR